MAAILTFKFRRNTASGATTSNPTLAAGEPGLETDTGLVKFGDGATAWTSLPYATVGPTATQTLTNKTLTSPTVNTPTATVGTSTPTFTTNAYTLALSDGSKVLLASNGATAGTINVPTNASVAFPVGTQVTIIQTGSGQLTVTAATPATTTIASTGATAASPKCRVQYSAVTLVKAGTDLWYVVGDVA